VRAIGTWQRRRGREQGVRGRTGTVTFVQRFGSALNANLHFHVVVPDGIFDQDGVFHRLPNPTDDDVEQLLVRLLPRLRQKLRLDDENEQRDDALAALSAASVRVPASIVSTRRSRKRLCANIDGYSLHAAVKVNENDHQGREHLCRYGARGPIAEQRLTELPDGRFRYEMKRPTADGRTHLVMTGIELLRKLAPLVPPPRQNLTRYHGVFAPNAKLRAKVTGKATTAPPPTDPSGTTVQPPATTLKKPPLYRIPWALLLMRVFATDVLACMKCGGRRQVIACIAHPGAVRPILRHLGLPDEPLPLSKARGPPQPELSFA